MAYQLIYVSASTTSLSEDHLSDILEVSRRRNSASGITGMLLAHDGNFFQVLEGPREEVSSCYGRILTDPRHKDAVVLTKHDISARSFADWAMGFVAPDRLRHAQQGSVFALSRMAQHLGTQRKSVGREATLLAKSFVQSFRDIDLS